MSTSNVVNLEMATGSEYTEEQLNYYRICCITTDELRGSVPKNGPIDFASKNHFSLNSADGKGLIPKY